MNPFFERLLSIMQHFGVSNPNDLAINHLKYSAAEKINRLKDPGANPSYVIVSDILNKWPELNGNWLVTGKGAMLLKQQPEKDNRESKTSDDVGLLAQLMKVQISVMEGQKETTAQQVELMKTLNTTMARQNSILERQATEIEGKVEAVDNRTLGMEANLTRVLVGVEKLSKVQDSAMKEFHDNFSKILSGKNPPSSGVNKKLDQTDGDEQKQGKKI